MAFTANSGLVGPYDYTGSIVTPIYAAAMDFFVNRSPLAARLPVRPLGATEFKVSEHAFRPKSDALNGAILAGDGTLVVDTGAMFMVGDVIKINSEYILITAISGNTLTISRGHAGTTAAGHADNDVVYLIGNTRTGSEVDQAAVSNVATSTTQYAQTVQHPYQVGGSLESATNYAITPGSANVVDNWRKIAMQNAMDDIERSYLYGKGVALASDTTRPMMKGLETLISTNNVTSPTNSSAYKPDDFIRDVVQPCFDGGGAPDLLVLSTDYLRGFAKWGHELQRLDAGATRLGTNINLYAAPFLGDMLAVVDYQLRTGTAIALTTSEVAQRVKRPMFDKPRGSRGDATEGDILWEGGIELHNEAYHSYTTGVTGFSV